MSTCNRKRSQVSDNNRNKKMKPQGIIVVKQRLLSGEDTTETKKKISMSSNGHSNNVIISAVRCDIVPCSDNVWTSERINNMRRTTQRLHTTFIWTVLHPCVTQTWCRCVMHCCCTAVRSSWFEHKLSAVGALSQPFTSNGMSVCGTVATSNNSEPLNGCANCINDFSKLCHGYSLGRGTGTKDDDNCVPK